MKIFAKVTMVAAGTLFALSAQAAIPVAKGWPTAVQTARRINRKADILIPLGTSDRPLRGHVTKILVTSREVFYADVLLIDGSTMVTLTGQAPSMLTNLQTALQSGLPIEVVGAPLPDAIQKPGSLKWGIKGVLVLEFFKPYDMYYVAVGK